MMNTWYASALVLARWKEQGTNEVSIIFISLVKIMAECRGFRYVYDARRDWKDVKNMLTSGMFMFYLNNTWLPPGSWYWWTPSLSLCLSSRGGRSSGKIRCSPYSSAWMRSFSSAEAPGICEVFVNMTILFLGENVTDMRRWNPCTSWLKILGTWLGGCVEGGYRTDGLIGMVRIPS